jgi:hypothetical protein
LPRAKSPDQLRGQIDDNAFAPIKMPNRKMFVGDPRPDVK